MPPLVRVFEDADFPALLNCQAVSFMRVEWPFVFSGENRLGNATYPAASKPVHFTITENDILISYAAVMRVELRHAGEDYQVAGFGNVFTYPAFRGEGFGRQVVDKATHYILASDADVAMLFCNPKLEAFYAASGWELLAGASTRIGSPDNYTVDPDLRMMLFVSSKGKQGRQAFAEQPLYIEAPW